MKSTELKTPPKILNQVITRQFVKRPWKNQTLYHRLVFLFKKEAASLLEKMKNCVHDQDMDNLHNHAHKLMGNCAVIGADRVWELVTSVSRKSGSGKEIDSEAISEIEKELTIFLHEVDLYLDEILQSMEAQS